MTKKGRFLCAVALLAALAGAPGASAMMNRGFYADCFTWSPTVCSNGSCHTYVCDQCDFYYNGRYVESTVGCY